MSTPDPLDGACSGAGGRLPPEARTALRARADAARTAAHDAAVRYVAQRLAGDVVPEPSAAALTASVADLARTRTCVHAYVGHLRALDLPPERALVLVKHAVLVETAPVAHVDRGAWEALQARLASWFVEAYYGT